MPETQPIVEATMHENSNPREFAKDFTDEELEELEDVVHLLTMTEASETEKAPTWDKLTKVQRDLLIKRYGQPRRISRQIRVIDYTKGEGCADNERGLPSGFNSNNFGIWDRSLLVFALYGSAPHINASTKIRIVPTGLVIGANGTVLLPDFFYTPSGNLRRELLIEQMNKNPRGDKSLRLAEAYVDGTLDTDGLLLTVYRRVGSRMSAGDHMRDSYLGKQIMDELEIPHLDYENPINRYRQTVEISKGVQQKVADIVSTSNLLLIKEAFGKAENINSLRIKEGTPFVHYIDINSGVENFVSLTDIKKQNGRFTAVKDPTWQYGDESRPFVYKYEYDSDGKRSEKYCYVSNREVFENE